MSAHGGMGKMKIRNGFVSNSSSSSFVLAFKNPKKCTHCGSTPLDFFDLLSSALTKEGYGYNSDIKREMAEAVDKLKGMKQTKQYIEYSLNQFVPILNDPEKRKIYNVAFKAAWDSIYKTKRTPQNVSINDQIMEYYCLSEAHDGEGKNYVNDEIETMKRSLEYINEKITNLSKYIEELKKYSDKDWKIMIVKDIDKMGSMFSKIENLIRENKIIALKEEIT